MINRYEVVVESREGSHAWLRVGRTRLATLRWPGIGARAIVRIRPEDVILCADPPGRISARNILPGFVRSLRAAPEGVYVTTDVGLRLTALVTREAVRDLRLRRGTPIFAVVKATAVAPEADVRPRLRIAVAGPRGEIAPKQLDFLRAIAGLGSISQAARESGIAYRTAWLWVRAMNRAWGAPLLARAHGGRGGGGTALTAQAQALLARVDTAEKTTNAGRG